MRELFRKSRTLRRLVRWYRSKALADPGWTRILGEDPQAWRTALERARGGPRVLLATSLGGYWAGTTLESLLAVGLTLRGADVQVLLCDGVLPACQLCEARAFRSLPRFALTGPQERLCPGCFTPGRKLFGDLGLAVHRFGENLTPEEMETADRVSAELSVPEIAGYRLEGVAVGEHARAGALRFFARGDLEGEPSGEAILRRYLKAAILTTFAARRLFRAQRFFAAAFHHGIYVPQGLIGEVARAEGLRAINWNPAYRKRRFIFSHGDTYHHTLLDEPAAAWEDVPWSPEREAELLTYLRSRWKGTEDWIWFHQDPREDLEAMAPALGLDLRKPLVGLLTNVIWDAQLHYPASAFPSMMEWLLATVRHFQRRPDLGLAIRIHPAEVRGTLPSRQRVSDELQKVFPRLPTNVSVIPPESELSTYALLASANAALIYGTKTGVELAATGIPVIVAGEAWVRGKGFTHDARSAEHYHQMLDALPFAGRLSPEKLERARKYAYHFFFRRMIPLECMEPTGGDPPYAIRLSGLDDLAPGRLPGLDIILRGILEGTPFIYPAEEQGRAAGPRSSPAVAGPRGGR